MRQKNIKKLMCEVLRTELPGLLHAEGDRVIAALKPKEARRYVSRGNGMHGPKTRMMAAQLREFAAFLREHPVTGESSRITRAHQCWLKNPTWAKLARATGEERGYSSYKALAAARY